MQVNTMLESSLAGMEVKLRRRSARCDQVKHELSVAQQQLSRERQGESRPSREIKTRPRGGRAIARDFGEARRTLS